MNPAIWMAIIGELVSIATIFYKKWNEAYIVNIAIFAEIKRLIYVQQKHKECWESGGSDTDIVGNVVRFYGAIPFINALQAKRRSFKDDSREEFKELYGGVLKNVWIYHGRQFDEIFNPYGLETPLKPLEARCSGTHIGKVEDTGGIVSS